MRKTLAICIAIMASVVAATAMPFSGPGLNTHGQLLPVAKMKAIGIRWVRGDLPPQDVNEKTIRAFLRHYEGMPVLWILSQKTPNAPDVARKLRSWGVTDIEVGNEPEQGEFNTGGRPWSGAHYGRWFKTVRDAVGSSVRLYGPATGTWMPDYTREAINAGMKADAISWHGYWKTIPDVAWISREVERLFRLPSLCSEIGFGGFPQSNYPVKLHPADAYIESKRALGNLAWCYYDGPNDNKDKRVGLFDWTGRDWSKTTGTYDRIRAKLGL